MPRLAPSSSHRTWTRVLGAGAALAVLATLAPGMSATAAPKKSAHVKVLKVSGVPATAMADDTFGVRSIVRTGKKTSKKSTLTLHLSADRSLGKDDTRVGAARVGKLKPHKKKRVSASLKIPSATAAGSYFVLACVARTCRPVPIEVVARPSNPTPDRGTLTGTLTYVRTSPLTTGQVVDARAQVNVAMRYEGPFTKADELQSTGSTYTWNGTETGTETAGECSTTTEERSSGAGTLAEVANPYDDEIFAGVATADYSELSLTTVLKHTDTVTTTRTGPTECEPGTTTGTPEAGRSTTELKLVQVSSTASSFTYRVSSFNDSSSTRSYWDRIDGTLTLQLG